MISAAFEDYSIDLDPETLDVTIWCAGVFAGRGAWDHSCGWLSAGLTVDCDAVLGDDPEASEEIYFCLDGAMGAEIRRLGVDRLASL